MSVVSIAVVGTGEWSTIMHQPVLKKLLVEGLIDVKAVCDLNIEDAQRYASALACKNVFADAQEMIDSVSPDGLLILVPPSVSHRLVQLAMKNNLPFLCEKPPVEMSSLHKDLAEKSKNLKHVIAYNRRFAPYIECAKEWMKSQELISVTTQFSRVKRMDPDFSTTAVHPIDTTQALGSSEFLSARIEVNKKMGVYNFFINGWSKGGVRYDVIITPNTASAEEKYVMKGLKRSVVISFPQIGMYDAPGYVELHENNSVVSRKTASDFGFDDDDSSSLGGILNEHQAFVKVIKGEIESSSTLSDTYATQVLRECLSKMISSGEEKSFYEIQI